MSPPRTDAPHDPPQRKIGFENENVGNAILANALEQKLISTNIEKREYLPAHYAGSF